MKTTKGMLWLLLSGILMFGLITKPDLWAAPGQSPARQTVPTRTPEQPPTPEPTKKPKPENSDPTAAPEVTPTASFVAAEGASVPLLPDAGGWSIRLHLGLAMIAVSFFILAVVRRRVWEKVVTLERFVPVWRRMDYKPTHQRKVRAACPGAHFSRGGSDGASHLGG